MLVVVLLVSWWESLEEVGEIWWETVVRGKTPQRTKVHLCNVKKCPLTSISIKIRRDVHYVTLFEVTNLRNSEDLYLL